MPSCLSDLSRMGNLGDPDELRSPKCLIAVAEWIESRTLPIPGCSTADLPRKKRVRYFLSNEKDRGAGGGNRSGLLQKFHAANLLLPSQTPSFLFFSFLSFPLPLGEIKA